MVAAWIRADTGVGPSMASGSQMYSGICADFPTAPRKKARQIHVAVEWVTVARAEEDRTEVYSVVPKWAKTRKIPIMKPQSPTRLVTNAFLPAEAVLGRSNQNEMSRYEQVPTPSHPRKVIRKLPPSTSISIEKRNRLRYTKNL